MQIDIVGGSYKNRFVSVNPERTINWYIHKQLLEGEKDKYKHSLHPFPGLEQFSDTTKTNLRGIFVARTITYTKCFVVADNYLYEISTDGTATSLGQMANITDDDTKVYMEVNGNHELMVAHNSSSYIYDIAGDTLTEITDGDFPGSVDYLDYGNGRFFVTSGGRVYYSDLNDGLSWTASSVFTPTAKSDNTLAAVFWKDDIHCFGSETIETYLDDGSTPFVKQGRDTLYIGLMSVSTLAVFEDGIIFVGQNRKGQVHVYLYNGRDVVPISSSSVNWQIAKPSVGESNWEDIDINWEDWLADWGSSITDAEADIQYSKDGHIFYYLTIPTLSTTFVFDIITQEWVERQSYSTTESTDIEFRGRQVVNFNNTNLWIDRFSGKVLKENYESATEDGQTITRTRISHVVHNEKKNVSVYSFELDCTTGVGLVDTPSTTANIAFSYSRNGGNTYSSSQNLSTGATTVYEARPRTFKLGTAREWAFKLVQTDAAILAINGAIIHGIVDKY